MKDICWELQKKEAYTCEFFVNVVYYKQEMYRIEFFLPLQSGQTKLNDKSCQNTVKIGPIF